MDFKFGLLLLLTAAINYLRAFLKLYELIMAHGILVGCV